MANRFVSTEMMGDPWYRALSSDQKVLWLYVWCKCDIAGIWRPVWDEVKFYTGVDPIEASVYSDRIRVLEGSEWFLTDFVLRQQVIPSLAHLNPRNACHAAIIKILNYKNILSPLAAPNKGLARGYSNGNSNGKHTTNLNHIDNMVEVVGSREESFEQAAKEDYTTVEWKDILRNEVGNFRGIGFKEDKIKAMFMTRNIPEAVIDKAMGKDF